MPILELVVDPIQRPAGHDPLWRVLVTESGRPVFDSAWVSIKFKTEAAASSFGKFVSRARAADCFLPPLGHGYRGPTGFTWSGALHDDCQGDLNGIQAHAEHLFGPQRKGGRWYCQVALFFHSAEHPDLHIASGSAARWLCEQIAVASIKSVYLSSDA